MNLRSRSVSWLAATISLLLLPRLGMASSSTANLFGEVTDASTNEPVADSIIVATSPSLQGEQTALSDEKGRYRISALPPGVYTITVTAPTFKNFELPNVTLLVGRDVRVKIELLPEVLKGEEIVVKRQIASVIDQGSATTGLTMTKDYMEKVAVGRTFEAIAEAAPGAQSDGYGVSFAGSTSPENAVFIDGVNAADPGFGISGTSLPLEFLDQVEVKTGGYLPEFGNASGAVINVITKIGGNEFHGSVFNYLTPIRLRPIPVGRAGQAITTTRSLDVREEFGFEIGGPIVKDFLWFHVGFAPGFELATVTRTFNRRVDRDGDGSADFNEQEQTFVTEPLPAYNKGYRQFEADYRFTFKLTMNASENHRITAGVSGNPGTATGVGAATPSNGGTGRPSMNGSDAAFAAATSAGGMDFIVSYDGKFLDKKFIVNANVGYHRQEDTYSPQLAEGEKPSVLWVPEFNLTKFEPNLAAECEPAFDDGGLRCPIARYNAGGFGFTDYKKLERYTGRLNLTYLLSLLGSHVLKGGAEFSRGQYYHRKRYTGMVSARVVRRPNGSLNFQDYRLYGRANDEALVGLAPNDPAVLDPANSVIFPSLSNFTYYHNYVLYLQDSWTILDRLNVNGGVRFDVQDFFGGISPGVKQERFSLSNLSPRVGLIYDFTGDGRSKLFGSFGRFYELVPLDMMDRQFPTESQLVGRRALCNEDDPLACPQLTRTFYSPSSGAIIFKPIGGQYVDMWQGGFEYQILEDLLGGITYSNSRLGDVIEDFSPDDFNTVFFGNAGTNRKTSVPQPDGTTKEFRADEAVVIDPLTGADTILKFPKPERRYDSISVYLNKSLFRNFIGNISYTYSLLRGHMSGLFRYENGQLDPNINSDLDLVQLMPNRYGLLPGDRTHAFKLDGAYIIQVSSQFSVVPNASLRLASGQPYSYNGPHPDYGPGEGFILTRGVAGRTQMQFDSDLGVNADYAFNKDTHLQVGVTIFNLFNAQMINAVDSDFVQDDSTVRPILGGDEKDLKHLKDVNQHPVALNPNFSKPLSRSVPMEVRFSAKLTF